MSSYTPAAADQPGAIAVQLTDYGLARDVRMLRGGVYVTPEGSDVAMPKLLVGFKETDVPRSGREFVLRELVSQHIGRRCVPGRGSLLLRAGKKKYCLVRLS